MLFPSLPCSEAEHVMCSSQWAASGDTGTPPSQHLEVGVVSPLLVYKVVGSSSVLASRTGPHGHHKHPKGITWACVLQLRGQPPTLWRSYLVQLSTDTWKPRAPDLCLSRDARGEEVATQCCWNSARGLGPAPAPHCSSLCVLERWGPTTEHLPGVPGLPENPV